MPWMEVSIIDAREEFCRLALREGANIRELCRRFELSPTTGYLWRRRYRQEGRAGLVDRPRRPMSSPRKTPDAIEKAVVALRKKHPAWGGRKLRRYLLNQRRPCPSASTVTVILERHGLLLHDEKVRRPFQRFEAAFPNDLWQMDYKGHFALARGGRCHPLTVLDDHARFALGIRALANERADMVQEELTTIFRRYGLPNRILCDNGPPWSSSGRGIYTHLSVWLLRLDVVTIHGRPMHPQTQGKAERFHRTLQSEAIASHSFETLTHAQEAFDKFRQTYNQVRPHEALGLAVPLELYRPSTRPYPEVLPSIEYSETDLVRHVTSRGVIKLGGKSYYVSEGFSGYPVAVRETEHDAIRTVFFRHYPVASIDLSQALE